VGGRGIGNENQVFELASGKWKLLESLPGDPFQVQAAQADDSLTIYMTDATYHFNGTNWTVSREPVTYGYAIDSSDGWTYSGTTVTHVITEPKKTTKKSYALKSLLPAKTTSNAPGITGIYAFSDSSVYAFASSDIDLPMLGTLTVLHYNEHEWTKVASYAHRAASYVTTDNSGGLWLSDSNGRVILHLSGGKLSATPLPSADKNAANVPVAVSAIPGSSEALAVSFTLPDRGNDPAYGEILQCEG
jgi:hypothetical protein